MITSLLSLSLLVLFPSKSFAIEIENYVECKTPSEKKDKRSLTRYFCSPDGTLKLSERLFLSTMGPGIIHVYDEKGRIIHSRHFKIEGIQTKEMGFEHNDDGTYIRTEFSTDPLREYIVSRSKKRMTGDQVSFVDDLTLQIWHYNQKHPYELQYMDTVKNTEIPHALYKDQMRNVKTIVSRTIYENGEVVEVYKFVNIVDNELNDRIHSFTAYNPDGSVKKKYSEKFDLNIEAVIDEQDIPESEKERRKRIYRDQDRPIVMVIDSGVDIRYPELTYKFFNNPLDTPNGVDEDEDGYPDNTMGWYFDNNTGHSPVITERLRKKDLIPIPLSHGTHVSSIVMKDIESFALAGFMGNTNKESLTLSAKEFMDKFQVHFVNMSFGIEKDGPSSEIDPMTLAYLSQAMDSHQGTLFFAAAGNFTPGKNIDESKLRNKYPAVLKYKNLMVVGALNTGSIKWEDVKGYKRAAFSNFGIKNVDVFAPGTNVPGAAIGGGTFPASGTSMSSPYVMNVAMKLKEANPSLSTLEIKEIIMRSVTFIDIENPLDCVTGGIVNPDRAMAIAKMMNFSSEKSIRKLNWKVRLKEPPGTYGEVHNPDYVRQIIELWNERFPPDYFSRK